MEPKKIFLNLCGDKTNLERVLIVCVCILCFVFLVLFVTSLKAHDQIHVCNDPACVRAAFHILGTTDPDVDPCEDFYQFSCGNFLKKAFSFGQPSTLHSLTELTKRQLEEIIVEDANETSLPRTLTLQRRFYRACMNTTAIEEDDSKTILKLLDDILGGYPAVKSYKWAEDDFSWTNVMVKARRLGVFHEFLLNIETFGLKQDSGFILWIKPPSQKEINSLHWRKETVETIADIAVDLGANSIVVASEIRKTMDFAEQLERIIERAFNNSDEEDTGIASNNGTSEEYEEVANITIKEIDHVYIKVDWLDFLRNVTQVHLEYDDLVVFDVDDYFKDLYYLLMRTPKRIQANYMAWVIISKNIKYMPRKIREKYESILRFFNETEANKKRTDTCFQESRELFLQVAEGEYVRRYASPEKQTYIQQILRFIKNELEMSLKRSDWMEEIDKKRALQKVKNITESIGWTKSVFNVSQYEKDFGYDKLVFTGSVIDMARVMVKANFDKYYRIVRENVTETGMIINAPRLDINAYYVQSINMLILPAPILQGQIFDMHRPQYMNYGALGTIIGHEYTHGFGEDANEFTPEDKRWTNDTRDNFHDVTRCVDEEYKDFQNETSFIANETSLEENLADYNGVNLAYRAYQQWVRYHGQERNLPGVRYTPNQMFWIMASTYMCFEPKLSKENDGINMRDPRHGFPSFRVTGRLRSSYEFAKDFGCHQGSKMNPVKKCQVFE